MMIQMSLTSTVKDKYLVDVLRDASPLIVTNSQNKL